MKFTLFVLLPALAQAIQPSNDFLANAKFNTECMKSGCLPFLETQLKSCSTLMKTVPTPELVSEDLILDKLSFCLCGPDTNKFVLEIQECLACFKETNRLKTACGCVYPSPAKVLLGEPCLTKAPDDLWSKVNITKIREAKNETEVTELPPKSTKKPLQSTEEKTRAAVADMTRLQSLIGSTLKNLT